MVRSAGLLMPSGPTTQAPDFKPKFFRFAQLALGRPALAPSGAEAAQIAPGNLSNLGRLLVSS